QQIISEDITLISHIRKQLFLTLMPDFTTDVETVLKLIGEIDQFFLEQDSVSIKTYFEILKKKIDERENLYKQAQALTHLGNWTWEPETDNFEWSDELYRIYELPIQSKIDAELIRSFTHPDDKEYVANQVRHSSENKVPYNYQYRIITTSGKHKTLLAIGEMIYDSNGKVISLFGTLQDITDRVLAEQKIKEQQHFIKHIADASPAILYLFDITSNKIVYINHEIKFVLGYSPNEIMEMETGLTELYHPDDLANVLENKRQLYISRGNSFIEYECRVKGSDGAYVWILVREIIFDLDAEGTPSRYLGAALDITERKEIENTLSTRNLELQQSNASLEEFAYVASHDLKEPLRKISIFGDRLLNTQYSRLTDDGRLYMDKIIDSSKRMQGLITDLLSVSMISADKSFEMYSLKTVLEEVTKMLEYKIEEKHAKVIGDDLPGALIIPSQMRQLFQNLINNSLKFVRPGTVPVIRITHQTVWHKELQHWNLPTGKKYLRLDFEDNGIGFDNMFAHKIFNIFQRLHTRTEYEGTGIGLAICKKIVENHGGIIFASGNVESGSVFTIIIPA
ncbi:MAG TPA: PAS domain-containing protein, partial [Chitinophagaceae bacterium]|nr:PAS domain-containing protein [Chitinophagaceae bacterium]